MWAVDGRCGRLTIDVGGSGHGGQVLWLMVV